MEQWKEIPGYEKVYEASTEGNIRSMDRKDSRGRQIKGKEIKKYLNKKGYQIVRLSINGKKKEERVHRLVLKTFSSEVPAEERPQVNHKNGIKTDNRIQNLEWVSAAENISHTIVFPSGSTDTNSLFSRSLVRQIFMEIWDEEQPLSQLAAKYKTTKNTLRRIQMRKSYTNETKNLTHPNETDFREKIERKAQNIRAFEKAMKKS